MISRYEISYIILQLVNFLNVETFLSEYIIRRYIFHLYNIFAGTMSTTDSITNRVKTVSNNRYLPK